MTNKDYKNALDQVEAHAPSYVFSGLVQSLRHQGFTDERIGQWYESLLKGEPQSLVSNPRKL